MAALQFPNGSYRVVFRYQAQQHVFTIGQVSKDQAQTKAAQVDYLLMRLKQRLATLPPGMGIVESTAETEKALTIHSMRRLP